VRRIGSAAASDRLRRCLGSQSWRFRAVGKSVGNYAGHPAQMAPACDGGIEIRRDPRSRSLSSDEAAGRELPPRGRSGHGFVHSRTRGDRWPRPWRARTPSWLCRAGVGTILLSIVLYAGCLSALAESTTSGRQSVGRVPSHVGLTLRQEEEGQMDRCLHVARTWLGRNTGPIGGPRDRPAHAPVAPVAARFGRSQPSVNGPTL
jgi:hypothetical protein